MFQLSNRER